jgi:glutathione S-transferase
MSTPPRPRLITLPLSHYCEKARWALDRAGIEYVEEPHVPVAHRRHTRRVGATSVPALVTPQKTYTDSGSIVRYADAHARTSSLLPVNSSLRQEAVEMELYLDRELGPHSRRWAYAHVLDDTRLLLRHMTAGAPATERLLAPVLVRLARPMIRRGYRVDPETAARSLERVREVFRWIDEKLADDRPFLVGETFSAADLTFASLAAPLVLPERYGGSFPHLDDVPDAMRREVRGFRATRPGRFALAMYENYRAR